MTEKTLQPRLFLPLPLGSIAPRGWLEQQLHIQANGLTGHLDEFWPDIADSGWIGGSAESWERGPYWLDGIVPLAYLLDDERLKAKVQRWMDYILTHQHADGWLGPVHDTTYGYAYDPWPVYVVLKAMTQYQEATGDERVIPVMQRFLQRLQRQMAERPLVSWAQMRVSDLVVSIYWLYERTHEAWLLELAGTALQQGFDWLGLYRDFPFTERQPSWTFEAHVVNNAMALKEPAIRYLFTGDMRERQEVAHRISTLDTYHGQATGIFTGDEVLAGKSPSQGTELCAVVEYLYSLEVLLSIFGEPDLADRWERIAYNALPATFKPDMWAHQYDQQANQVQCVVSPEHVYATNGPEANLYGLEPNFGCCTANMHQGWPKFATHLWMRSTAESGLVALAYAPCQVQTEVAGVPVQVTAESSYPFEDEVRIHVSASQSVTFPVLLHIPAWTQGATVTINDHVEQVQSGTFYRVERTWRDETDIVLRLPMAVKAQTRYHRSVSLERGPLVYALKIGEEWRQLRGEEPHADWELYPTTPWNYALEIDREHPEQSCEVISHNMNVAPFSLQGAPVELHVKGRRLPEWGLEKHAAAPVPVSPVESAEPEENLVLIPYGCTSLRVTEFPTLS